MQAISSSPVVVNATSSAAVVKHDTSAVTAAKHSIKVGANAKVKLEKKPTVATPIQRLETMESATRNWEANELAASNQRLYSILMDAYTYYMTMKTDTSKDVRALYADDLANALVYLMLNYNQKEFVNVGYGNEITIKDLALLIKKIIGFEGHLEFDTSKPNGTPRKLMDSSRLFATGWKPKTALEEGIALAYQDFLIRKL